MGDIASQTRHLPVLQEFQVRLLDEDEIRSRLAVSGDLDLSSAGVLASVLDQRLESGRKYVDVDVSALTFCDSSGLGVFLNAHHRLLGCGGMLILTGVPEPLLKLLTVTGLDDALFTATADDGPASP